ncbi:hypothetical protein BDC45DRAFT_86926 [Circinella umbellata]|nr:hypothetical protein BDC45DRAFT_86926 [Circinella umbellata]
MFRSIHSSSRTKTWVFRALILIVLLRLGFFTFSNTVTTQKNAELVKAVSSTSSPPHPPPSLSPPPLPPLPPPPIPTEARLENVLVQNNQPLRQPNTYMPGQ